MEIRIKTGLDLACEYTHKDADVLVKFKPEDSDHETLWMGEEALLEALKLVRAMSPNKKHGASVMVAPVVEAIDAPPVAHVAPPPQQPKVLMKDNPAIIHQFEEALVELVENPPSNHKEDGSLAEIHVRELVHRFKAAFMNPAGSMYPVVQRVLGMPKNRFEIILAQKHG